MTAHKMFRLHSQQIQAKTLSEKWKSITLQCFVITGYVFKKNYIATMSNR